MDGAAVHRRRPRPVADAPPCDAVAVAKGWLLALVADAPLHLAGAVPTGELARGGPAICGAVLAALSSDAELDRLLGGDGRAPLAASVGRLAGARTASATATAVDALRAVVWQALRRELRDPAPGLVADLAARLGYVCARISEASLAAPLADPPGRAGPLADVLAASAPVVGSPPHAAGAPAPAAEPEAREPQPEPPQGVHVFSMPPDPAAGAPAPHVVPVAREGAHRQEEPVGGIDGVDGIRVPVADPAAREGAVPIPAFERGTITRLHPGGDAWTGDGPAAPPWLAAIAKRLERRTQDGRPFAALVVEVDDLDRLLASESGREVAYALEVAERGLTAELAPADLVVRERLGRWWLTSPDRDALGARDLGTRVAAAIAGAVLGGAPMRASVGVAVCPDDGEDVDALAGRADQSMFAARAAGLPVA